MDIKRCCMLAMFVWLTGCTSGDTGGTDGSGQALFDANCAECHKKTGRGNFFEGIPANANTRLDKKQVIALITQGLSSHPQMPTFSHLSKEQAELIADHLITLAQ